MIYLYIQGFSMYDAIELDGYDSDFGQKGDSMSALANFEKQVLAGGPSKKAKTKKGKKDEAIKEKTKQQQSQAYAAAPSQIYRPTNHVDHHATLDSMFGTLTKSSDILSSALSQTMPSKEENSDIKVQNKINFLLNLKEKMPAMSSEIDEKVKKLFKEL